MKRSKSAVVFIFLITGGLSSSLFFISAEAVADTITLKNGKDLKGLVVERHTDRIILSTEKGEIPILLSGIKNIQYDDPEQNFMQIGRAYEAENKYGEALAYYEKALEVNPDFDDAKKAAAAMKSRFWAQTTEGPQGEMEKQQAISDSWSSGDLSSDTSAKKLISEDRKTLHHSLGLMLLKKGDWVIVDESSRKSDADVAGLEHGDRLVAIDAESLRYLGPEVVAKKMLLPHYSSFTLDYEREYRVEKAGGNAGLHLKLDQEGTVIEKVDDGSAAADAGLRAGDLVMSIDGKSTRYMPLGKVTEILRASQPAATLSVRRSAMLSRK